jgi:hypothetical protein
MLKAAEALCLGVLMANCKGFALPCLRERAVRSSGAIERIPDGIVDEGAETGESGDEPVRRKRKGRFGSIV